MKMIQNLGSKIKIESRNEALLQGKTRVSTFSTLLHSQHAQTNFSRINSV